MHNQRITFLFHPVSEESDGESPTRQGETEEDAHLIQGQNLETKECCAAVEVSYAAVEEGPRLSSPPEPCNLLGLISQSNDLDDRLTPLDDVEETPTASQSRRCESNGVDESVKPEVKAENADGSSLCDTDTSQDETVKDAEGRDHESRKREEEVRDYKSGKEEALEMVSNRPAQICGWILGTKNNNVFDFQACVIQMCDDHSC